MKNIKTILLLALLFMQTIGRAQNTDAIRVYTDSFPDVSLVYRDYHPQVLEKSDFQYLKEDGGECSFELSVLPENHSNEPLTTLFLWEDMARFHNNKMIFRQYEFTRNVLASFFDNTTKRTDDQFGLYVFNRIENGDALTPITNGFLRDKASIRKGIDGYPPNRKSFNPYPVSSNLFEAISKGVELLTPVDGAKCIVIFTAGYAYESNGATKEYQVIRDAQNRHIPIYVFQYYEGHGKTTMSKAIADDTFGTYKEYKDADIELAKTDLAHLYSQMRERYFGHSYKITFQSNAKRGGGESSVSLKVRGEEVQGQFLPPSFSLKEWIKNNVWLFVGIVVVFLTLIGLAIWLIRRSIVRRNRRMAEKEAEMQGRIFASDQKLEEVKRQQEDKECKRQEEIERKNREAEEERLINLMRVKNLYPRLQCVVGTTEFTYTIGSVVTAIGRADHNDVVLKGDTVSRDHAVVRFTTDGFDIINRSQTNPMIVNGSFAEKAILKNADIVGLGEAVVTFYL